MVGRSTPPAQPATPLARYQPTISSTVSVGSPSTVGDRSVTRTHRFRTQRPSAAFGVVHRCAARRPGRRDVGHRSVHRLGTVCAIRTRASAATNSSCVWSMARPRSIRTDSAETERLGSANRRRSPTWSTPPARRRRSPHRSASCASHPDRGWSRRRSPAPSPRSREAWSSFALADEQRHAEVEHVQLGEQRRRPAARDRARGAPAAAPAGSDRPAAR